MVWIIRKETLLTASRSAFQLQLPHPSVNIGIHSARGALREKGFGNSS